MADRAWILAALIDGPQFQTLQVRGRYSVDHDVWKALIEHRHRTMEERRPGVRRQVLMVTAETLADGGDPDRWSAVVDASGPVRHRLETSAHTSVDDGTQVTTVSRDRALVRPVMTEEHPGPPLGDLLEPIFLAIGYEIADPVEMEHLGRRCAAVTASLRPVRERIDLPSKFEFGDHARLVLDLATGLIVKWQSWFDGAELGDLAVDELAIDEPVADSTFVAQIPPAMPVRTPEELRAEMQSRRRPSLPSAPPSPREALDDHMPHGDPPTDHVAAEAEIRDAVEGLATLSADGRDAVNVHGGEGLGAAFRDAATRQPREVRFALDAARFLGPDEAAIAFHVEGDVSMGFEGRALRVDGRWLLERRTVTRMLRLAGATIPPPPTP